MSFRGKLLAVFALTVFLSLASVTWIVSDVTRRAFERADDERAATLLAQFRREFGRRGDEVVRRADGIATGEAATRMALAASHGAPDYAAFLNVAKSIAADQQLDFLEFVDAQGTIISSAQWPAKFGYQETSFPGMALKEAFLQHETLPDGVGLGLSAIREVTVSDKPLYVIAGRRLDKDFLTSLELPSGTRAMLYQNLGAGFSAPLLIDPSGTQQPEKLASLIEQVQKQHQETGTVIHWSADDLDDETVHAIPLSGRDGQLLGILLVGNSRRPYVGLRRHIRSAALLAGSAGIVLAIVFSGWAAGRVTRPVEELAEAAREVAAGNWNTQVRVASGDEIGQLAETFNRMTSELMEQKEQLVQTERVAAWRELARRLAHELNNPLFPLQLTVENLVRARQQSPAQFEEVFRESSSTLLTEIANLKTIVSRFSEFSKMPQPRFQRVDLNETLRSVARLFQAQLHSLDHAAITCNLELAEPIAAVAADPDLLHRAFSNLVLNAMDAMPQGGTLTLRTRLEGERAIVEIADTGTGLTSEECERLFTPYYTSKAHGTGLGLAIVQSVVSDHAGKISVRSQPGRGTTFVIELPRNPDKLPDESGYSPSTVTS